MLTSAGIEAAARDDRNNQLWSVYRQYADDLDLPTVAEDRLQEIAQVLPADAVAVLERRLDTLRTAAGDLTQN